MTLVLRFRITGSCTLLAVVGAGVFLAISAQRGFLPVRGVDGSLFDEDEIVLFGVAIGFFRGDIAKVFVFFFVLRSFDVGTDLVRDDLAPLTTFAICFEEDEALDFLRIGEVLGALLPALDFDPSGFDGDRAWGNDFLDGTGTINFFGEDTLAFLDALDTFIVFDGLATRAFLGPDTLAFLGLRLVALFS